jgi:hypothetical protein
MANAMNFLRDIFTDRTNEHYDHTRILYFISLVLLNVFQAYAIHLGQPFDVRAYGDAVLAVTGGFAGALGFKQLGGTG